MKKLITLVSLLLALTPMTFSQTQLATRKIKIQHADPYLVLLLISQGYIDFELEPETSTKVFGNSGFSNGFGGGSYSGGSRNQWK